MANESAGAAGAPQNPNNNPHECGREALGRFVERSAHSVSGLRVGIDRCPDATITRSLTLGGIVGLGAGVVTFFLTRNPATRIAAVVGGAVVGCLASRYHVSADWDPDRSFAAGGRRY